MMAYKQQKNALTGVFWFGWLVMVLIKGKARCYSEYKGI